MRNVFADEITRLAVEDKRIVLLSGDIGNRLFNNYKEEEIKLENFKEIKNENKIIKKEENNNKNTNNIN